MTDTPLVPKDSQEWPPLAIDAREYLQFLDECDWTEDQKREFIEALWQIIVGFVDVRLGIHPIQQIQALEAPAVPMLDSAGPTLNANNTAPSSTGRKRKERNSEEL